jgi:hypothetical protein
MAVHCLQNSRGRINNVNQIAEGRSASRNYAYLITGLPITVAARFKAWTVFARSNAGILGSNPTQGMDVCVCVYSVFVLFCMQVEALRRPDPSSKESCQLCIRSRNWRSGQGPTKGSRAIIIIIIIITGLILDLGISPHIALLIFYSVYGWKNFT